MLKRKEKMITRHCPYKNCPLQCMTKQSHNAFLHNFSPESVVKSGKSKKIDYFQLAIAMRRPLNTPDIETNETVAKENIKQKVEASIDGLKFSL